ncbi:MAG: 6,7-dimethyl-8-ribityllumazine synthase [Candidatus Peribacteria bacterium]|nr:6,7-dimethyl-8-ribityllumazine synthase [Candidatus Peribacteria bacterium]
MKAHTGGLIMPKAADSWKIGIVYSSYYKEEMDSLVAGARAALMEAGIEETHIETFEAPGSFEVPLIGAALAETGTFSALMGFGIILEGATHHARLLAEQVAAGIMQIQINHVIPFAFEILYVNTIEQARERAFGEHNKGREAAYAVLHSLVTLGKIRQ